MRISESNITTRLIPLETKYDIEDQLESLGLDEKGIEEYQDRLKYYSLKIENLDTRGANLLARYMENLGGEVAMSREARSFTVRETDLIVSGNLHSLLLLSVKLKGESFGLDEVSKGIEECLSADNGIIHWNGKVLDFHRKTYVMGILNVTPDSFYPESRASTLNEAVKRAEKMLKAGVDIIDIGGESSRPGSEGVSTEEEIKRVIPAIDEIRKISDVIISVDTRKHEVAEKALEAGADIINDISGLRHNFELAKVIARAGVPIILMHMRGTPKTMQQNPYYRNTIGEIIRELQSSISFATGAGISREKIIIDPGIGFGKRLQDNLRIIRELRSFKSMNFPVLIGVSRKSFIGELLNKPVEKRLIGTIVANTLAILNGANIVRVHDVSDTVEMIKIIDSIRGRK